MTAFEIIQSIASVSTAIGVAIGAWQLLLSKREAESQFEDGFAEQYRHTTATVKVRGKAICEVSIRKKTMECADLSALW